MTERVWVPVQTVKSGWTRYQLVVQSIEVRQPIATGPGYGPVEERSNAHYRRPRCEKPMPSVGEPCARLPGHRYECRSRYAMDMALGKVH